MSEDLKIENNKLEKVADALGDIAGMLPVFGGFVTAYKNYHLNLERDFVTSKIINFINDLNQRVKNLEELLYAKNDNPFFQSYSYNIISTVISSITEEEYRYCLNYFKEYLNDEFSEQEEIWYLDVIRKINPTVWRIFIELYEYNSEEFFSFPDYMRKKGDLKEEIKSVSHGNIDIIVLQSVSELIKNGLLQEIHPIFTDNNPSVIVHNIKISEIGKKVYLLLTD